MAEYKQEHANRIRRTLLIAVLMTAILAFPAFAAKAFQPYAVPLRTEIKVDGYWFWQAAAGKTQDTNDGYYHLWCGKTLKTGVMLCKTNVSYYGSSPNIYLLSNGKTVYYIGLDESGKKKVLGSCAINGSGNKTLLTIGSGSMLLQKSGTRIYYTDEKNGKIRIWYYDTKTKKSKLFRKNLNQVIPAPGTKYIANVKEGSKYTSLQIIGLSNNKIVKTIKITDNDDQGASSLGGTKKYFYYAVNDYNEDGEYKQTLIFRVPVKGNKKPSKIAAFKSSESLFMSADDTYVYYGKSGRYYRYSISKKKSQKVKMKDVYSKQLYWL